MSGALQIDNADRQQFVALFRDPNFYREPVDKQRAQIAQLPVIQRVPLPQRSKLINGLLEKKDQIRQQAANWKPQQPQLVLRNPQTGQPERINPALIPPAFQTGLHQAEQGVQQIQQPGMRNKAGGLSNVISGGMQMLSGTAPVAIAMAPEAALTGVASSALAHEGLQKTGLAPEYVNLGTQLAGIAGGGARAGKVLRGVPLGRVARQAKEYGVEPEVYQQAHAMPIDQLTQTAHEALMRGDELRNAQHYNEQAGAAIATGRKKLNELQRQRTAMELALQDTAPIDQQIFDIESRLSLIHQKIAQNQNRIETLKKGNAAGHERLYTDVLRARAAAPKPRGSAKTAPQPEAQPVSPQAQQPASQSPVLRTKRVAGGQQPPQLTAASTRTPEGAIYAGPVEGYQPPPQRQITGRQPRQVAEAPQRKMLTAPEERTQTGAIYAREATPPPPKPRPVRGLLERPQEKQITTRHPSRQITAPKHRYQPYTVEYENGKPVNVIQPEKPGVPPKPRTEPVRVHTTQREAALPKPRSQPSRTGTETKAKPTVKQEGLGTHIIQNKDGSWRIVGSVPAKLAFERKDGGEVTPEDIQNARHAGPGIAGLKTRTWPTKEEAEAALRGEEKAAPPKPRSAPKERLASSEKPQETPKLPKFMQNADEETKASYLRLKTLFKNSERGSFSNREFTPEEKEAVEKAMPDLVRVGKHIFDYGVKNFKDWSSRMTDEIGAAIKPYLDRIWAAMGNHPKAGSLQEGTVTELPKEEIHLDPKRFQFKSKAVGRAGVTDKFKDVTEFNPKLAGDLLVWKDPADGKTYAVNGHHRLEIANRTGYDKPIKVRYINAKTAAEARAEGAITNIGEDNGDPLDVAKVLRDTSLTPQDLVSKHGISSRNPLLKQGAAIAKLSDPVFDKVASGEIPEGIGAIIGDTVKNPVEQEAAAELWKHATERGRKITDGEFREAVQLEVSDAPSKKEEDQTLFGTQSYERSLVLERGDVSQYVRGQLASDKRLFRTVAREKNVGKLGETGNIIKQDENAERARQVSQALEVYDKLKRMSGPVKEVLDQAAKDIADGQRPETVKRRAYDQIRESLGADLSKIFGAGQREAGSGNATSEEARGVPPQDRRGLPEQRGLGTEKETERFNKQRAADLGKQRAEAQLKGPIQQGDKGRVVEEGSPLFRGQAIDTREPQGDLFGETPAPPKKKELIEPQNTATTGESHGTTPPPRRTRESGTSNRSGSGQLGRSGGLEHAGSSGVGAVRGSVPGVRGTEQTAENNRASEAPIQQRFITVGDPPKVTTEKVPQPTGGYKLRPDQEQTTALAINQLEKGGGFLNASGTGAGKTGTAVGIAKYFSDRGKKVLIVAPKNVWGFDKNENPTGSYKEWFDQYAVNPTAYRPGTAVEPGKTYISTYERFKGFPSDRNTILVLDESHALKNADSARSGIGLKQIDDAGGVYFMTATPADKPYHIQYLSRIGILQGRTKAEAVADLGMELVQRQHKDGSVSQAWQIRKGFTPKMIRQRFADLFDKMIREGKMRKDEISLENMDLGVEKITLPEEAHQVARKIERELGLAGANGLKKAVILGHVRRQQEPFKIDAVVSRVQRDSKSGRKAVVFLSRVNRSDVVRRDKMWIGGEQHTVETVVHSSEGTAKTLKQRLQALGLKVAEIHGGSETGNTEAMRQFQSGEADAVIATAPSGGVGINLDDTNGTDPRSVYVMTPEFDAMNNVQLVGRAYRASTKTRPIVRYLFADTPSDNRDMEILSNKIKTLQSVVKGESGKLNMLDYIRDSEPEEEEAGSAASKRRGKPLPQPGQTVLFQDRSGLWRVGIVKNLDGGRINVEGRGKSEGQDYDIAGLKYKLKSGAAPSLSASKPLPEIGQEVFFKDGDVWRLGKVASTENGRIEVIGLGRAAGQRFDITGKQWNVKNEDRTPTPPRNRGYKRYRRY